MKLFQCSFILIVFLCLVATISASPNAYEIFTQGLELEQQLRIFEARDRFRDAIAMDPVNTGYMTHYAWFLHNNGFHEEAASVFTRLLPMVEDKDKEVLYRGLGWTLKVLGRLEASLSAYQKVFPLKSSDQNFRAAFEEIRWILYNENAQTIKAIKLKLSAHPYDIELKEKLFRKYVEQGELDNAIRTAKEIMSEDQINKPIHLQFARVLFWQGNKRGAETEYRRLITEVPKNAFLYFELAQVLDADGRTSEAKTMLDVSLSLYPDSARTRKKLAEVLARSGKSDEAANMASTITPSGENRLTGLMARARAFHFGGRLEKARAIYKTVLDEYPYNTDALWGLTETSIYTGNYRNSLATLARWNNAISDDRLKIQEELIDYYVSPVAGLKGEYYSNSSDFSRSNAGANYSFYAGRDSRLNAGYYTSDFQQDGFEDIFRHTLFAEGQMRVLEHFELAGCLAGNFYDNDNDNLNGRLSAYFRPSREITAAFNYKHIDIIDTELPFGNAIYNYVVTIGAVGLDIKTNDYGLYLLYAPHPRISLAGDFIYGDYSDGNRKKTLVLEAGYKLSHIPFLRAAYNYFYLDFRDPAPLFTGEKSVESAYYDPINYETHTLRLEFRHDYGKRFTYGLECAVSYIPKSDGTSGSAFASAAYKLDDHISLNLDARWFHQNKGIDRIGKTGHFWSRNLVLAFEYRF